MGIEPKPYFLYLSYFNRDLALSLAIESCCSSESGNYGPLESKFFRY